VIRSVGITGLAAIGAATAMLWLSPAIAGDQSLPGATVESVVAIAKRLNPTVAAASLEFDAAVHKIGTAGVLADPALVLEAWDVNRLGVGQRRFGIFLLFLNRSDAFARFNSTC
jgi:cobalt-zinc-cadmium efflux system outer membrane protein